MSSLTLLLIVEDEELGTFESFVDKAQLTLDTHDIGETDFSTTIEYSIIMVRATPIAADKMQLTTKISHTTKKHVFLNSSRTQQKLNKVVGWQKLIVELANRRTMPAQPKHEPNQILGLAHPKSPMR